MFSSDIGSGRGRFPTLVVFLAALLLSGAHARAETSVGGRGATALLSPRAEEVSPKDAWRLAEQLAATRPGCEVFIGSGGSMSPLYPDRTVIVVEPMPMSELRVGMTVVFYGDSGRLVAHTLIAKTARGWVARGIANRVADETIVRFRNYVGTVIRAFAPNPRIPALVRASSSVVATFSAANEAHAQ